ncbi:MULTISPECIES: hypothetical protein [unclassified Kitasatospora]|uniref:hypothetical protein n=1 Tax=unclassified Kitasatospora TaxID=2633591 RepID=UPI0033D91704
MAAQTVIGLVGIVTLAGVVVAVVAVWRTGSPFPPLRDAPPRGPDCASCGHRDHDGSGCSERVSASGDIYDGAGDWVGYMNETYCNCGEYRTEPWPSCTTCGHSYGKHHMLLRCRHITNRGARDERACPCLKYCADPGPKPSS